MTSDLTVVDTNVLVNAVYADAVEFTASRRLPTRATRNRGDVAAFDEIEALTPLP